MKKSDSSNYFANKIKNPLLKAEVEDAQLSVDISMQLYALRKELNITQAELAIRAEIPQSNIARLEHPGYQGYTLKVLSKVVRALGAKLRIQIIKTNTITTERYDFLSESRNISSLKKVGLRTAPPATWKAVEENVYA